MQRKYDAPQFRVQDTRTVAETRVERADTRPQTNIEVGDSSWKDKLFQQFAGVAEKGLNKAADIEYTNLYLEGQAAAGVIQSEEELQGNPLTRDWKVAGYRDTMGKLALADQEAQFAADLPDLRQQDPEKFNQYLSERRGRMTPAMAGMSREARAAAAGQMLLQDRAATQQYTAEHAKFIIEQKSQAIHTQVGAALKTLSTLQLQAATGQINMDSYLAKMRSTAGVVVGSIWMDPSLKHVAPQLTYEVLQNTLAQDQVDLYEFTQNNAIPDGKGGESTLVSRLPAEAQVKLANQYREAYARTNDARSMYRFEQVAQVEAQIDNDQYQGTDEDLKRLLQPMVLHKTIPATKYQAILNKYYDKSYKNEVQSGLADATLRGDVNYIYSSGKSIQDGVNALEKNMGRRGITPEQRLQTWLKVGDSGLTEGYKKAGEYLGVSLRSMVNSKDGTVLPQHVAVFKSINSAIRAAEDKGYSNTRATVLSGLGEEDRMFAEQIMRRVDDGASVDEAVARAQKIQEQDSQLTPSVKAARGAQSATQISKEIDSIESRNWAETAWAWTKSAFGSQDATADLKLRPYSAIGARDNWFSDGPTVQFYTESVKNAVRQEANNTLLIRPSASVDEVMSVAKANVAARTIKTQQGPLIMPRNVNLQSTFGVGPGNQAAIGDAIDGILHETVPDSRWQLTFDQGRLFAQEFNKDGQRVGNGVFIGADQIKAKIVQTNEKELVKATETYGPGKTVSGDGVRVQYNGTNTAGVQYTWMMSLRDNLVAHEGIKSTPYTDLSGNKDRAGNVIQTVGVGVSSHNPRYPKVGKDGKVTGEEINRSFLEASNDAATAGAQISRNLNLNTEGAFLLFSELAYQSGTAFMSQKNKTGDRYREFADALNSKDVDAAQDAFKQTAAWYYSRDPKNPDKETRRQKSYLRLIEKALM